MSTLLKSGLTVLGITLAIVFYHGYIASKKPIPSTQEPILTEIQPVTLETTPRNNITQATVMIVNNEQNSGGSGLILRSDEVESTVLTNAHVCRVVENGGLVVSQFGTFQAVGYKKSPTSDLCTVTVAANLRTNTRLAPLSPAMYEDVSVSGHPALMPNLVTKGHLSGKKVISVMTGYEACTEEDRKDEDLALLCMFMMGYKPVIQNYESALVSATIMPGSSGSGVYDSNNNLIGLVFAGSGQFGYAWTVPYEQVQAFLNESEKITETKIDNKLNIGKLIRDSKKLSINDVKRRCLLATHPKIKEFCDVIQKDVLWER